MLYPDYTDWGGDVCINSNQDIQDIDSKQKSALLENSETHASEQCSLCLKYLSSSQSRPVQSLQHREPLSFHC